MSAFLGPIHHWLYGKIQLQEAFIAALADAANENHWNSGDTAVDTYVNNEVRPLDEMIDTMNIHGWLQDRIHDAEGRYAKIVGALLHHNEGLLPELENLALEFGRSRALKADADAAAIYRAFEDAFLNGMPCDRINQVVDQNPKAFAWNQTGDLHGDFWKEAQVEPSVYYTLRDAMMRGMLEQTEFKLDEEDHSHYVLRPKTA